MKRVIGSKINIMKKYPKKLWTEDGPAVKNSKPPMIKMMKALNIQRADAIRTLGVRSVVIE
jgi:hypothetical protein